MIKMTFISLLRGINVGGKKSIKMDRLQESFEELGLENVRTYVQSGNVIFMVPKISAEALSQRIREKILADFGVSVSVLLLSSEELNNTIKNNPFLMEKGIDPSKLHVTFLSEIPKKSAIKELEAKSTEPDEFRYSENRIYLYCPNGYGRTKLSNNTIEKILSVTATTRNWKTVNELYRISSII
jgi:uncharacterized protein (DUF1697 family)